MLNQFIIDSQLTGYRLLYWYIIGIVRAIDLLLWCTIVFFVVGIITLDMDLFHLLGQCTHQLQNNAHWSMAEPKCDVIKFVIWFIFLFLFFFIQNQFRFGCFCVTSRYNFLCTWWLLHSTARLIYSLNLLSQFIYNGS